MDDLTYKEYKEFIDNLILDNKDKEKLKKIVLGDKSDNPSLDDLYVTKIINLKEYDLVNKVFNTLGENIEPLLKYGKWKSNFIAIVHNLIGSESGYQKNIFLNKVVNLFIESDSLSLKEKDNSNYFLNIFKRATKINNKNEEQSIVHTLHTLFQDRNNLDKKFLMELFAIYIENINPDSKYQGRVKEIKSWAINQDFSEIEEKYPKIRDYFNQNNEEQLCYASIKRFDLKEISERTRTKLVWVQENFDSLNNFLESNLMEKTNIHSFSCKNDGGFRKVIVVYEKRDAMVEAITNIHDILFETIRGSKQIEDEIINKLWQSLILKADIEKDLDKQDKHKAKTNNPSKFKI